MKLQQDKVKHIAVGFIIAMLLSFIHPVLAFVAVIVAGVGKEVWDSFGYGTVDYWDIVATVAGGVVGTAVWCLV